MKIVLEAQKQKCEPEVTISQYYQQYRIWIFKQVYCQIYEVQTNWIMFMISVRVNTTALDNDEILPHIAVRSGAIYSCCVQPYTCRMHAQNELSTLCSISIWRNVSNVNGMHDCTYAHHHLTSTPPVQRSLRSSPRLTGSNCMTKWHAGLGVVGIDNCDIAGHLSTVPSRKI